MCIQEAWTRHGKCLLQIQPIKDFLGYNFLILNLNSSLHFHLNFQSVPSVLEKPHLHFISLEFGIEFHCNFQSYLAINSYTLSCNVYFGFWMKLNLWEHFWLWFDLISLSDYFIIIFLYFEKKNVFQNPRHIHPFFLTILLVLRRWTSLTIHLRL